MGLATALRAGIHGIRAHIPPGTEIVTDEPGYLKLYEPARNLEWMLAVRPDLRMDLREAHRDDLRRHAQQYARRMFEDVFVQMRTDTSTRPRTDDPDWSPLVELEHVTVGPAPGLRVVHRMFYQPGREILLGHLVIPLPDGVFEARVAAGDGNTGYRESILLLKHPPTPPAKFHPQSEYDDPRYDANFRDHPLSRVRAALRELHEVWGLEALTAPTPQVDGPVDLPHLGCAIVPPPRFVLLDTPADHARFVRVSFCTTDGCDEFVVSSAQPGATPDTFERVLSDARGRAFRVALRKGPGRPFSEADAELDAAARSLRFTTPPPRPWWKLW